jgi:acyl carrier protein
MNVRELNKLVTEFSRIRRNAKEDEIALLEVALFVEDLFGMVLSDEEICEENLGTHEATENFLLKKLNLEGACAESVA